MAASKPGLRANEHYSKEFSLLLTYTSQSRALLVLRIRIHPMSTSEEQIKQDVKIPYLGVSVLHPQQGQHLRMLCKYKQTYLACLWI